MKYDYLIVGAGFSGAVLAERLATQLDKKVIIVEKRNHIGGNAYDEYDENGILIHKYGPHVFHTNVKTVFEYLSQFTEWRPYEHKVLANLNGELYPIPINRITVNKLYGKNYSNDEDVAAFYESVRERRSIILNSEDIMVNKVGYDLFNKFFRTYTKKQWGLEPKDLAPSVCGRITVRTNEDCSYFEDKYQFMPRDGYTRMFENMLRHKNIEVMLNADFKTIQNDIQFDKMIYTSPIDYFFDYEFGKLQYRSIRFEFQNLRKEFVQSTAVINSVDDSESYTRVTEYKYLTAQLSDVTTITKEYTIKGGEPYYPVPTILNRNLYSLYARKAKEINNVFFCGRLAQYQYYNMDQTVANALTAYQKIIYN